MTMLEWPTHITSDIDKYINALHQRLNQRLKFAIIIIIVVIIIIIIIIMIIIIIIIIIIITIIIIIIIIRTGELKKETEGLIIFCYARPGTKNKHCKSQNIKRDMMLLGGSYIGSCARNIELSAVTNGMSIRDPKSVEENEKVKRLYHPNRP